MSSPDPTEETLRKCLELEWQDHIQTRRQTWKALAVQVALAIGLVALDWQVGNLAATTVFGVVVIAAAQLGIQTSLHHREVEIRKFTHILRLEEQLGLHRPGLFTDVSVPAPIRWADAFRPGKSNTVLFILRMHVAVQVFALLYVAACWIARVRTCTRRTPI